MSKIDEKMLQMVVDMAAQGGKMEARHEAQEREIEEKNAEIKRLREIIVKRDARINELEGLLLEQQSAQPKVVVNQYFMLSVPLTRDYVSNLSNDGRQFVGHMLHHTMPAETPRCMFEQVDEMTRLNPQDGSVVIHNNNGPVNGNIATQNVGSTSAGNEKMMKQLVGYGREEGCDADFK